MDYEAFVRLALDLGAQNAVVFETKDIEFDSRTLLKCMYGCKSWGKNPTCPSREGSLRPWEYEMIFRKYQGGIIIHCPDKKLSQNISFEVERQAFFQGFYFALSLSDCDLCPECAGLKGLDCRNPVKARPSFHSVGIDVFKTVRKFSLPIDTHEEKGETLNWYSAVFIE
ncbi:MAG TPA: DUF2284 domain-containing protein [Anaerovoracaceae bacterium]|nr:DUF2284 domain-containing protein [Anaerovoracaceae bacterium]